MINSVPLRQPNAVARLQLLLQQDKVVGMLFLVPGLIVLCITYLFPLLFSLVISFSDWNIRVPGSPIVVSGLQNYVRVLQIDSLWGGTGRTLIFTVVALVAQLVLGTIIAVTVTSEIFNSRMVGVTRAVLLVPLMLPPVVMGILWRLVFNVQYGPLNYMLGLVGVEAQMWIAAPDTSLWAVILVEIWANTSVVVLILVGGILSLPRETVKAAQVDGASSWRILVEITLPQLRSYFLIIILIRSMDLLKTFDFIYAMTYGGPGSSTEMLNLYIYRLGSRFFEYTQSAAASWLFLLVLLPLSIFLLRKALAPSEDYLNN